MSNFRYKTRITKLNNCKMRLTAMDDFAYKIKESDTPQMLWDESVSIDAIYALSADGTVTFVEEAILEHTENIEDLITDQLTTVTLEDLYTTEDNILQIYNLANSSANYNKLDDWLTAFLEARKEVDELVLAGFIKDKVNELAELFEVNNVPTMTQSEFAFPYDGLFELVHYIIPTETWFNRYTNEDDLIAELLDGNTHLYFYKSTEENELKCYTLYEKTYDAEKEELVDVEVTFDDLYSFALNDFDENHSLIAGTSTSNIIRTSQLTFSLCNLLQCYYDISEQLLIDICLAACPLEKYNDLKHKRDILWMAANIIKYCLDQKLFLEALKHLEWVLGCGLPCINKNNINFKHHDCGCTKHHHHSKNHRH